MFVHRLDFLPDCLGDDTSIGRVRPDVIIEHGLFQCVVEDAVDVFDSLGGKCIPALCGRVEDVVELLDVMGGQRIQTNGTEPRLQMVADGGFIGTDRGGFHIGKIFTLPCVQPLTNGHLIRCDVSTSIQSGGEFLDLLRYFLLCLSGDGFLNLFSGTGIETCGVPAFPVRIFFSVSFYDFLSDTAATCGAFLAACHDVTLLSECQTAGAWSVYQLCSIGARMRDFVRKLFRNPYNRKYVRK